MWKICIIALQQWSQLQWTTWSFVRKGNQWPILGIIKNEKILEKHESH